MSAGTTVLNGRYRLDHLVGRGGFARVYLGTDLVLRRYVAIKVLDDNLVEPTGEGDFLARFEREARAVAQLDHPNILGIHDYGEAGGVRFLVMPYVDGGSLDAKLRAAGRLSPEQTLVYLRQAAAALDYAHTEHRLVHRDIKPQNMLLRARDDRLLLADFGIAKVISSTASAQSRSAAVGTLSYMAPEQFQGRVVPVTDVYALGCVLFQLLAGAPPYEGATEQVMYGHLLGPVPSLAERCPAPLPPGLSAVIGRALAKRPEERFPSAGALADAFGSALAGGEAAATIMGPSPEVLAPPIVASSLPPHPAPAQVAGVPPAPPRPAAPQPVLPRVEVEDRRQAPEPVEAPAPAPVPQSATPAWLVPGAGLALIAGGLLWLAAVVGIAAEGYVTEELRGWLIVAGLLLLAGLGGFLARHGRAMGRAGRGGLLLTGFGIVLCIGSAIALDDVYIGETSLPWSSSLVLVALPVLLFLLGVGGLLARADGTGLLARGAGPLTVGGLALVLVGVELNDRYLDLPSYESGRFVFIVGLALLAVALVRTGALPRWSGFTLLGLVSMSTLLTTLPLATGIAALGDGLVWIVLGVLLWSSARAKAVVAG